MRRTNQRDAFLFHIIPSDHILHSLTESSLLLVVSKLSHSLAPSFTRLLATIVSLISRSLFGVRVELVGLLFVVLLSPSPHRLWIQCVSLFYFLHAFCLSLCRSLALSVETSGTYARVGKLLHSKCGTLRHAYTQNHFIESFIVRFAVSFVRL